VIKDNIEIQLDDRVATEFLGFTKYKILPKYFMNALRMKKKLSLLENQYGKFDLKISNLTVSNRLMSLARISNTYYCIHENLSMSNLSKRSGLSRMLRKRRINNMLNSKNIVAVSEGINQDLVTHFNVQPGSVKTIYNPVNIDMIRTLSQQPNPFHGLKYLVHVGRMTREKRHDVLLDAYKMSKLEHSLILVGDGPLKSSILAKVQQLELEDKVIFAGKLKNPYPVMEGADLLVLSSDYEGFGIVLTEALALHTPVVSTDCQSGPREIMSPGFLNYLAPVDDPNVLSQKIRQAIADLEKGKISISDSVVERFLVDRISRQYLSLCG
jgi:glycosyltransferase involved in cell wall biosynthesis